MITTIERLVLGLENSKAWGKDITERRDYGREIDLAESEDLSTQLLGAYIRHDTMLREYSWLLICICYVIERKKEISYHIYAHLLVAKSAL